MTEPTPERLAKLAEQLPVSALRWFRAAYPITTEQTSNPIVEVFLRHVYYGVPPVDPAAVDVNVRTACAIFFDEGTPLVDAVDWLHGQTGAARAAHVSYCPRATGVDADAESQACALGGCDCRCHR